MRAGRKDENHYEVRLNDPADLTKTRASTTEAPRQLGYIATSLDREPLFILEEARGRGAFPNLAAPATALGCQHVELESRSVPTRTKS